MKRAGAGYGTWLAGLCLIGLLHEVTAAEPIVERWRFATDRSGSITPAIAFDGTIYYGAGDRIYALNPGGGIVWDYDLGDTFVFGSPSVGDDGSIYFGVYDRRLVALTPAGTLRWEFATLGRIQATPVVGSDGTVYVGCSEGRFYAVSASGEGLWHWVESGSISGSAVMGAGGIVYTQGSGSALRGLAADGQSVWSYPVDGGIFSTPAVGADGTFYFGAANVAQFHAVDSSGTRLWMAEVSSGASMASPVIGLDGTVYCGGTDGRLFALDRAGQFKWSVPLGGEISGTPALAADGSVYLGTSGRKVFRVSDQGVVLGEFETAHGVQGSALIRPDGDVVVSDDWGTLYVLEGVSPPGGGPWPTHMQNGQRTGRAWVSPLVTLVSPLAESEFVESDSVRLAVEFEALERPVVAVRYLSNSNEVMTVASAPFEADWVAPGGVHHIQARATDDRGAAGLSDAVRIKVVPPETAPVLLVEPAGVTTTTNGGRVTLSVDVFGSGPLTYEWYKDGVLLPAVTGAEWSIEEVGLSDAAHYEVRVSNAFGETVSSKATVHVLQTVIVRWITPSGTAIHTTPAIGRGGIVYYANDGSDLLAFDPRGTFEWWHYIQPANVPPINFIRSSPVLDETGMIFFGSQNRQLHAVDPDGAGRWEAPLTSYTFSSPALGMDGTLYIGTADGHLLTFDADGEPGWTFEAAGEVMGAPAIGTDGTIYFTSAGVHVGDNIYSGRLYAVNPVGELEWEYITGDYVSSSPAIDTDGTVYFGSEDRHFYAMNPDGSVKWSYATGGIITGSAVIGPDGTIYFGDVGAFDPAVSRNRGHLHALTRDGELRWRFQANHEIRSTPAVAADGTVYFGTQDWMVYALNPNGTMRWSYETLGAVQGGLTIGFDGTVYVPSLEGRLYALFDNPSPLAESPWPKFKRDHRNTGNANTAHSQEDWLYPFAANVFDGAVTVVVVDGQDLYAGGEFRIAGGRSARGVARWDGRHWHSLGAGVEGSVRTMAMYQGELYVGGGFQEAGGEAIAHLARWDGSDWTAVGAGIGDWVTAMVEHEGVLFVLGSFSQAGGWSVSGVARWDGSEWMPAGTHSFFQASALGVIDGELYAAACGLGPPDSQSCGLLRWTGNDWEVAVHGFNLAIHAMAWFEDHLVVGGRFTRHGSTELNGIARWDGQAWHSMEGGLNHDWVTPMVQSMTVFDGQLHAGGVFLEIGDERVNNLARWDGSDWHALGKGLTGADLSGVPMVNSLVADGDSLLVGGLFMAADGNREVRHLARWQDHTYRALGEKLGFRDGRFHLTLLPDRGVSYGIEASTNLIDWERIVTFTSLGEAAEFIDEASAQQSRRFYRAVSP
jgi:outer membrane protein assembly factor BamB